MAFVPDAQVLHHMGQSGGRKAHLIEQHTKLFMERYYSAWRRFLIAILDRILS